MVHLKAFPSKQDARTAIPEPAMLICQFAQPLAQDLIALILLLVLKVRPVKIRQFKRPTLRQSLPIHHVRHSFTLYIRR